MRRTRVGGSAATYGVTDGCAAAGLGLPQGTSLFGALLLDAKFVGTDLTGADLESAVLEDADLTNAILVGAQVGNSLLRNFGRMPAGVAAA